MTWRGKEEAYFPVKCSTLLNIIWLLLAIGRVAEDAVVSSCFKCLLSHRNKDHPRSMFKNLLFHVKANQFFCPSIHAYIHASIHPSIHHSSTCLTLSSSSKNKNHIHYIVTATLSEGLLKILFALLLHLWSVTDLSLLFFSRCPPSQLFLSGGTPGLLQREHKENGKVCSGF